MSRNRDSNDSRRFSGGRFRLATAASKPKAEDRAPTRLDPIKRLAWVAGAIALVGMGALSVWYAMTPRISLLETEVAQTLVERGLTAGRMEIVVQQALQRFADDSNGALDLTPVLRAGSTSDTRTTVRATAVHSFGAAFADVESRALAITLPGQTLSAGKVARLVAFHIPWAKRQTFVTLRFALSGEDEVDVQVVVARSDGATSIIRITGKREDLSDPASALVREVALEVMSRAMPALGLSAQLSQEMRECKCIRAKTVDAIRARVEDIDSDSLSNLLGLMIDTYWSSTTDASVKESIDRLRRRARLHYDSKAWTDLDQALFASASPNCELDYTRIAIADNWRMTMAVRYGSPLLDGKRALALMCIMNLPSNKLLLRSADIERVLDTRWTTDMLGSMFGMVTVFKLVEASDNEGAPVQARILDSVARHWAGGVVGDSARIVATTRVGDMSALTEAAKALLLRRADSYCVEPLLVRDCVEIFRIAQATSAMIAAQYLGAFQTEPALRVELCQLANALRPETTDPHTCIARAYEMLGEPQKAAAWYLALYEVLTGQTAYDDEPANVSDDAVGARKALARMLLQQGLSDKAEAVLLKGRVPSRYADDLAWIAMLRCDSASYERLLPTVSVNSELASAAKALWAVHQRTGGSAERYVASAHANYPFSAAHEHVDALLLLKQGNFVGAQVAVERTRALTPGDVELDRLDDLVHSPDTNSGTPVTVAALCLHGTEPVFPSRLRRTSKKGAA